jgi:hypothetical protein
MNNRQQQATSTAQRGRERPHRGPGMRGRAPGNPTFGLVGVIEHAGADNSRT